MAEKPLKPLQPSKRRGAPFYFLSAVISAFPRVGNGGLRLRSKLPFLSVSAFAGSSLASRWRDTVGEACPTQFFRGSETRAPCGRHVSLLIKALFNRSNSPQKIRQNDYWFIYRVYKNNSAYKSFCPKMNPNCFFSCGSCLSW